ncbi:glycosyltransferase family 2 protein [Campylobacter sp. RM12640]|uniref:glycosyltransferase family 2 protein n=1 Tax=unclassified Campylobacter TaxID=2593542 RepID=UPI003014666F|nr:glycosyltransferase family 2 protein [Campylobacter sp. RM12640]MBZ7990021.1 glycosyltransferase family 2 protein [Campylobacter sp. RM12635]
MLNIVIPAAGLGSRFSKVGYENPKPFIDVAGEEMIVRVIKNLAISKAKYIVILQKKHADKFKNTLEKIKKDFNVKFVLVDGLTEGTACTVLEAADLLKDNDELLIANSDQIVDFDLASFINDANKRNLDGSILTFEDLEKNPKWSFVEIENGLVLKVREKEPISTHASVGIYYFKKSKYFKTATINMINANDRVNNEFYTAPTYNYLIQEGKRIGIFKINKEQMHGIGTPEDLNYYLYKYLNKENI